MSKVIAIEKRGSATTAIERAQRMTAAAKAKDDPARVWWLVTHPGCVAIEVAFNPPQTASQVQALYPGCGVVRGSGPSAA